MLSDYVDNELIAKTLVMGAAIVLSFGISKYCAKDQNTKFREAMPEFKKIESVYNFRKDSLEKAYQFQMDSLKSVYKNSLENK